MKQRRAEILTDVVQKLSLATTLESITQTVAQAARALAGADGATFVLREGNICHYADENAISPLWKGKRFPMESCVSGWAMLHKETVVIKDIYADPRVLHVAYRPTFVKSLCMVPVRAADPMAAIGNYWASGHVPTDEEVRLLEILANSAAIALENYQLKEALQDRTQSNQTPSDVENQFESAIHTLAHDLRNPLSTMMLFTELLQARVGSKLTDQENGYLESILKTAEHASEQIRKMLAIYSVRDSRVEKKEVDLSSMASEISGNLRAKSPHRKIQIDVDPEIRAMADPHLIHLALENLIANAFKYTGKKSEAFIEIKQDLSKLPNLSFYVRDNGDGFSSEDGKKLFRPMVRLHSTHEFPGTGLGLASAARIIELHGGHIRAEGKKSEGATFYVDLPA